MKFSSLLLIPLLLIGCTGMRTMPCPLASISIIDANGISETISNEERLKQYQEVDFHAPQPYKKVLRVYKRDEQGNICAYITSYHANGEVKQALEVVNGRASGEFREWHENGVLKVEARVIGGNGDLYPGVESSWLFEGSCKAFNTSGNLEAEIFYVKGKREGTAFYYHENGTLWKEIPMQNDQIVGESKVYFNDGTIFETSMYCEGRKHGPLLRYWKNGTIAAEENYENGLLVEACYRSCSGDIVSKIDAGNGYKAIFDRQGVCELQEFRNGIQEGCVQLLGKSGKVVRTFSIREGIKHGEEIEYYPLSKQAKLSMTWSHGKLQGVMKTWYANGVLESQREMAGNKKMGLLSAWYSDGSIMLLENYEQDKLIKGEYYTKGNLFPVSTVDGGEGVVTLFDSEGTFIRKVNYRNGKPDE